MNKSIFEKHKRFWVILIAFNLIILGVIFNIYLWSDYSVSKNKSSHYIGMSYMTMNNEFYSIMSEEIISRIEAAGDRYVLRDPALDAERQSQQIREMLEDGIEVLIITPVDSDAIIPALKQAKEQGVKIIVLDSDVEDESLPDCTITSDNYRAGQIMGEQFLSYKEEHKVVVLTHEATVSGQERVKGFEDTVSENPNIKIIKEIESEGQTEIAMPQMEKVIESGLEFDDVFCLNDQAAVGAVAALKDAGLLDGVDVYGVDASPDAKALIHENMMKATSAQFPTKIGAKAADILYDLLKEKKVEKSIKIPVSLVTEGNVEQFGIDRWQ